MTSPPTETKRLLTRARDALNEFARAPAAFSGTYCKICCTYEHTPDCIISQLDATGDAGGGWRPTHRHYKGGLYRLLGGVRHSETLERLALYENEKGEQWVRPWEMFHDTLPDGRKRFEPLPTPPAEPRSGLERAEGEREGGRDE